MSKNKARGAKLLAAQRRRADANRPRPTLGEALARHGLVAAVQAHKDTTIALATAEANDLGRRRLRVVTCHACTAPKACCKTSNVIFLSDAITVAARLRRDARDTPAMRAALAASAEAMEGTNRRDYLAPCVFLDDAERCTVYDVRPTNCATAYVYSAPHLCSDRASTEVTMFASSDATGETTALTKGLYAQLGMVDRTGKSAMGMLPRMVLVALEAWDRPDYAAFVTAGDWAHRAAQAMAAPVDP